MRASFSGGNLRDLMKKNGVNADCWLAFTAIPLKSCAVKFNRFLLRITCALYSDGISLKSQAWRKVPLDSNMFCRSSKAMRLQPSRGKVIYCPPASPTMTTNGLTCFVWQEKYHGVVSALLQIWLKIK